MDTTGQHLLAEFWNCTQPWLDDTKAVEEVMLKAAELAEARVVNQVFHHFSPQGVTGVVVVEESHLSVHTWPERGYVAVDVYTCGNCKPERAIEFLKKKFGATRSETVTITRGQPGPHSMHFGEVETEESQETPTHLDDLDAPCSQKPPIISSPQEHRTATRN